MRFSFCFEPLFVAHCPFPEIVPFSHALCFPFAVMLTDPGAVPKNAVPLSPSFKMHLSDMSKTKYTSADDKHMIATTGAVVCMRRSGYKHVDLAINSVTARCIPAVSVITSNSLKFPNFCQHVIISFQKHRHRSSSGSRIRSRNRSRKRRVCRHCKSFKPPNSFHCMYAVLICLSYDNLFRLAIMSPTCQFIDGVE